MTFGSYVRQLREAKGMTLEALGSELAVAMKRPKRFTAAYVSDVELGRRAPWADEALPFLAEIIGADLDELRALAAVQHGSVPLPAGTPTQQLETARRWLAEVKRSR